MQSFRAPPEPDRHPGTGGELFSLAVNPTLDLAVLRLNSRMWFALSVPETNRRGPRYVKQLFDVLQQANTSKLPITLRYARYQEKVGLFCNAPDSFKGIVANDLPSLYDGCEVDPIEDEAFDQVSSQTQTWSLSLHLTPDVFPLPTKEFEDALSREFIDPIAGILSRISEGEHQCRVDLTVFPASRMRARSARRLVDRLATYPLCEHPDLAFHFARLSCDPHFYLRLPCLLFRKILFPLSKMRKREVGEDKVRGHHLFEASLTLAVFGENTTRSQAQRELEKLAGAFAPFSIPRRAIWITGRIRKGAKANGRRFLLSSGDIAELWHPITQSVGTSSLSITESREFEADPLLKTRERKEGDILLGETTFRRKRCPIWISREDRLRHALVIGRTGTGKSTLFSNMFIAEMQSGEGCCLIDPHGDLVESVLPFVPQDRFSDLILFDAGDVKNPLAFNVLATRDPLRRFLVADSVLSAFSKIFGLSESTTPRLISILRNALLTVLEQEGSTLLDLSRLLTDSAYRNKSIARLKNIPVKNYWIDRFHKWTKPERTKAVEAVLNKLDTFTLNPLLQSIVGRTKNTLDLRKVMDEGKILLINLSKGRMGDDGSHMLGALLVTSLQLAAMSRADIPADKRRPFFCYIDEFQNFATSSFETILSEARKYGLGLLVAHQYQAQIDEETAQAVFGNVGTLLSFQVGSEDAKVLSRQFCRFEDDVRDADLINLPRYSALVRLLVDGMPSRRFTMQTLPPPSRKSEVTTETIPTLSQTANTVPQSLKLPPSVAQIRSRQAVAV